VGTCDHAAKHTTGWFYRVDARGHSTRTAGPFICTNGPAFSPDGKSIYCVDSFGRAVHRYAISPSGHLSNGHLFRSFDDASWGYPDGLTCDVDGCVWIAHWGGSRVSRFSPDDDLVDVIPLPVAQPTSCTFGGPDLHTLSITSASLGVYPDSNRNGLAGAVFAVDLDTGGLPTTRFNG
jgi:D-xylonolactonase